MPTKFHATRCTHDCGAACCGPHPHDSLGERDHCFVLHQRQAAGEISELRAHPVLALVVNGVLIGRYTADWYYVEAGQPVWADFKGVRTREWQRTRKLVRALYGIELLEVRR